MIETIATVESNDELVEGFRLLVLNFNQGIRARAGQFAMLKARASLEPLLRRALAVYKVYGPRRLSFLYHVMGRGTEALAQLARGGEVEALIPLGNGWLDDYRQIASSASEPQEGGASKPKRALVVAGGIGSASVFLLCEELISSNTPTQVFFGAANERVAVGCGLEDFQKMQLPLTVTTDDGSLGERGFVTAPLERCLREIENEGTVIYTCGPWVMMRRVAEIADQFGSLCLASLEAPMGCGFGVCVGCVVAVKTEGAAGYGSYKRVCIDGSIFPAEMIRWEINAMAH